MLLTFKFLFSCHCLSYPFAFRCKSIHWLWSVARTSHGVHAVHVTHYLQSFPSERSADGVQDLFSCGTSTSFRDRALNRISCLISRIVHIKNIESPHSKLGTGRGFFTALKAVTTNATLRKSPGMFPCFSFCGFLFRVLTFPGVRLFRFSIAVQKSKQFVGQTTQFSPFIARFLSILR